jgi:hypothetical protein
MIHKPEHSLIEFIERLQELLGQPLNDRASFTAEDFFRHMDAIRAGINSGEIRIGVDMLYLSLNFPEYKRYQAWKGVGWILLPVALIVLLFSWKISAFIIGISLFFFAFGSYKRHSDGRSFQIELVEGAKEGGLDGMAKICAHYIAGTVGLLTPTFQAFCPLYPSTVFTGEHRYIKEKGQE